jgi:hypothetical protein
VGDLDFLVAAHDPAPVVAWFTALAGVRFSRNKFSI